jgi:hypothetical protein
VRRNISLNQQWELSRNLGLRLTAQREFSHDDVASETK